MSELLNGPGGKKNDLHKAIKVTCSCGKVLAFREVSGGKTSKCPDCWAPIQVPLLSEQDEHCRAKRPATRPPAPAPSPTPSPPKTKPP